MSLNHHIVYQPDKSLLKLLTIEHIDEEAFMQVLKQYNLIDALQSFGAIYQAMFKCSGTTDFRVHFYWLDNKYILRVDGLAKSAHYTIMSGANKYRHKNLSSNMIANMIFLSSFPDKLLENNYPFKEASILNYMCKLSNEQLKLQKNIRHLICRNYLLFKEAYDAKFLAITGLTLKEYYNVSLLLILFLNRNQTAFYIEDLLKILPTEPLPYCSKENITKVIDYLSIDIEEYKNRTKKNSNKSFMQLEDTPIIKINYRNKTLYIVPSPSYFIEKIYNGIFYDIEKTYKKRNDFTEEFGHIFENYVGKIIKSSSNKLVILSENNLHYQKNGVDAVFVDWLAYDNDTAYLIEVKSIQMPLKDIYNTTITGFIETHIIPAYKQIINKINDIDKYTELSFLKNKNIKPIIVFRGIPFCSNYLYQSEIIKTLENFVQKNCKYQFVLDFLKNHRIFLFSIEDFELYWTNRAITDLDDLFDHLGNENSIYTYLNSLTNNLNEVEIFDDTMNDILDMYEKFNSSEMNKSKFAQV